LKLLFVGDTHGEKDLGKVNHFLAHANLRRNDAIIHCGDIGVAWAGEEDPALFFWRSLPMKVILCLGNHENYPWIMRQPIVRRFGARGYDLGGQVFAPLPGQTVRLGRKKLWFYPGGFSIDYPWRTPGKSIHMEELMENAASTLIIKNAMRRKAIDYIISHDGPLTWVRDNLGFPIQPPPESYWNHLKAPLHSRAHPAFALDAVYKNPDIYTRWYFGHHHVDIEQNNLRCLWKIAVLEDTITGDYRLIDSSL
jgi:hypothetical protein